MNCIVRRRGWLLPVLFASLLAWGARPAFAQDPFQDAIKQLNSTNVKGYIQPFITSFGANQNSGIYHSAEINDGISVRLDIVAMGSMIGDAQKTYDAVAPYPFPQTPVKTATLFGGMGTTVKGPAGTEYQFQNGQVKTDWVPFASPQLTIGNIYGTQAVIRYVPIPEVKDFPKITLFGIGLRHSLNRYLQGLPVDLAATVFYQKLDIGDIFSAKGLNFGAQASKSFSVLTLYGGLGYESSSVDLNYTYTGYGSTPDSKVSVNLSGENNFRGTIGLGLNLIVLNFFADISAGNSITVASGGVGFGF